MLKRYENNPIFTADNVGWRSIKVYNPTVIKHDNVYHLFYRAVGDEWVSRIAHATSTDGLNFIFDNDPLIVPEFEWESSGCEDPRITFIEDKFLLTYTAFDGVTAQAAVTSSFNLKEWGNKQLLFTEHFQTQRENLPHEWSKSAGIFPEQINGKYMLLYGDNHIWPAYSSDLTDWEHSSTAVITPREGYFDSAYVEMGPAPVKTKDGWLVLYHGIDEFSEHRTYGIGAVLLDLENPLHILWRSSAPIIRPEEHYETVGLIDIVDGGYSALKNYSPKDMEILAEQNRLPKAVFCCGALLEGDLIRMYYGAADTVVCTATVDLKTLFQS